jgi:hypothetical protein
MFLPLLLKHLNISIHRYLFFDTNAGSSCLRIPEVQDPTKNGERVFL